MLKKSFILIAVMLLGGINSSQAQNAYVSDNLEITFRTGPGTDRKILRMLSSGQPLEIISSQGEWSQVRHTGTGGALEGWVLSRYLTTEVPCKQRAEALVRERDRLQARLAPVEKDLKEKTALERELAARLENTSAALQKAVGQYESLKEESVTFLALKSDYETAKSDLQNTRDELESLTRKHDELQSSEGKKWFVAGAGVLLCGLLLGLVFGRREKKRKSAYY